MITATESEERPFNLAYEYGADIIQCSFDNISDHSITTYNIRLTDLFPPKVEEGEPVEPIDQERLVPVQTYEDLWRIKFGTEWVIDSITKASGALRPPSVHIQSVVDDPFYKDALRRLFKEGKLERTWVVGTDAYAYRLGEEDANS